MEAKINTLKRLGADHSVHINGALIDHLIGTYDLLNSWGARSELCDAGLFHAIYGPDGLGASLVSLEQRSAIAQLIGASVENLVYFYCACDKEYILPQIRTSSTILYRDRFSGDERVLKHQMVSDLCEIMAANEIDVCGKHDDKQIFQSERIRLLLNTYVRYASMEAKAAVESILTTGRLAPAQGGY